MKGARWIIVLLSLLSIVSCLGSAERLKLRFAFWGGPEEKAAYEKMIAAFNEAQDEIELIPLHIPEMYEEKVLVMIGAGDIPDIIALGGAHVPHFAAVGAVRPLDDLISPELLEAFYPRAREALIWDGHVWGLPFRMNTKVMAVNLDMLEAVGIEPPSAEKIWTPEEYLEAAKKLTVIENGKIKRWGSTQLWFYQWIHQFGGRVLDETGTICLLATPEVLAAAKYIYEFRWVYNAAPAYNETAPRWMMDLFLAQEAAMMCDVGPYHMPLLVNVPFKWALAPQPGVPGYEGSGEMEVVGLAIPALAPHPEASFKALAFLTGDRRSQDILALTKTQIPGLKVSGDLFAQQFPGAELFIKAIDVQIPQFKSPNTREISRIIGEMILDVLFGPVPTAEPSLELFQNVCKAIEPYLKYK